jgi:hypothetical protein
MTRENAEKLYTKEYISLTHNRSFKRERVSEKKIEIEEGIILENKERKVLIFDDLTLAVVEIRQLINRSTHLFYLNF